MRVVADFHFHSKYAMATSKKMDLENIAQWAKWKGLNLIGTADCTHPLWSYELAKKLEPAGEGVFKYKGDDKSPYFIITGEVSTIFNQDGKTRRMHTLFFVPGFESLMKVNKELAKHGKIASDGRPVFGLSSKDLVKILWEADERCFVVPAHIWTPWFSLFGSKSGFDGLEECYGELSDRIYALETGLSSDPPMNWRISNLDTYTLLSNSDAHSGMNMMREANVFDLEKVSYGLIVETIKTRKNFLYTLEYFPQEGMYHWDGHRDHATCMSPKEAEKLNNICPICKKPLTIGVEHRVFDLADREAGYIPKGSVPCKYTMPLDEIIAEALAVGANSKSVLNEYHKMVQLGGSEFEVLIELPEERLRKIGQERVIDGILKVRRGDLTIRPGYDGQYGEVTIFDKKDKIGEKQTRLF